MINENIKEFDVLNVSLSGKNVIEASAGTGKTYTIGILVLRLLLEKNIPIQEILMVTFTRAAVAELSERVRRFVNIASVYASSNENEKNESSENDMIFLIVDKVGKEISSKLLKTALTFLDEIAIFTIHGFCHRMLSEFAFETGQIINPAIDDMEDVIERSVSKYFRKKIIPLSKDEIIVLKKHI